MKIFNKENPETVEKISIDPKFQLDAYLVLRQRSQKAGLSMNQYIINSISEFTFKDYEIRTHNLEAMIEEMDTLVQRAPGYYLTMVRQERISEDLGKHILNLYQRISDKVSSYYSELLKDRNSDCDKEELQLQETVDSAQKNYPADKSVTTDREKNGFLKIWLPPDIHKKLIYDMEKAGYNTDEVTRYLTDMIMSKRLINLSYYIEDIRTLDQIIYKATKPCPTFLRVLASQGKDFEEMLSGLSEMNVNIQTIQKDIWHIVMNDRKKLFQKYQKKIRQSVPKKGKNERRRSYREKGE